jgi:hypothetical protein
VTYTWAEAEEVAKTPPAIMIAAIASLNTLLLLTFIFVFSKVFVKAPASAIPLENN